MTIVNFSTCNIGWPQTQSSWRAHFPLDIVTWLKQGVFAQPDTIALFRYFFFCFWPKQFADALSTNYYSPVILHFCGRTNTLIDVQWSFTTSLGEYAKVVIYVYSAHMYIILLKLKILKRVLVEKRVYWPSTVKLHRDSGDRRWCS